MLSHLLTDLILKELLLILIFHLLMMICWFSKTVLSEQQVSILMVDLEDLL